MMRCLFSDVVTSSVVWIVPVAGKDLAKDWVQGLLDPPNVLLACAEQDAMSTAHGGLMCQPLR